MRWLTVRHWRLVWGEKRVVRANGAGTVYCVGMMHEDWIDLIETLRRALGHFDGWAVRMLKKLRERRRGDASGTTPRRDEEPRK